jgi:putative hydrolase of the HAD superfamily
VGRGFDETYHYAGGDPEKDQDFIEDLFDRTNLGKISEDEFRQAIIDRIGIKPQAYDLAVRESEQPNYELLEYIKTLRSKYKTAVLSNANVGVLDRKINPKWLNDCFDELIVSAEVGFMKPSPEIYKLTAKKLVVDLDECVFIDDKTVYCDGATALGMKAIWYRDFPQMKKKLEILLAA